VFCDNPLDCAADLVNPGLVLLVVATPLLIGRRRTSGGTARRLWLATVLTLAAAYALAGLDAALHLWVRLGLDYSTHTAVAVALAASLGLWRRRLLAPLILVVAGYAVLMVRLRYHTLGDITTTAAVVAVFAYAARIFTQGSFGRDRRGDAGS
jgi:hypothetical protein